MVVSPRRRWFYIVGGIDMGWGIEHTPFYIPDPRQPEDLKNAAFEHFLFQAATTGLVYAYSGLRPGPGHVGILYHAFFSRQHVGAAYAGTNAFDDTMFALSVYSEPFQHVGRVMSKIAVPIAVADVAVQTISDPSDNPFTRGWQASPTAFLFGDHYWQQHGVQEGTRVAFSEMAKNFHLA